MGYFDDAIAEREESLEHGEFSGSDIIELSEEEYLEHGRFGSFRKTHKYIDRIWKGGKWVYRYAKKAAKEPGKYITGSTYKKEAKDERERSEYANELAGHAPKALMVGRDVDNVKKDGSADFAFKSPDQWARSAEYHGRKSSEAESNYYNKSLAGKVEKGLKKFANNLKPKETATVTDVSTGEKRSANGAVYDHLEKQAKKKKKFGFKHKDMDGSEFRYFPARSESILKHDGLLDNNVLSTKIRDILD